MGDEAKKPKPEMPGDEPPYLTDEDEDILDAVWASLSESAQPANDDTENQ